MPKVVDHEKVRIEVVEAAARVIARVGVDRASIRMIAAECGRSPAAPLHYFGSRDELFDYAFKHFSKQSVDELRRVSENYLDELDRLAGLIECLLERSAGDVFFARSILAVVMGTDSAPSIKRVDVETYEETTKIVRDALERARIAGRIFEEFDLDAEAGLLITLADGLVVAAITLGDQAVFLKERLKEMLLRRWGIAKGNSEVSHLEQSDCAR